VRFTRGLLLASALLAGSLAGTVVQATAVAPRPAAPRATADTSLVGRLAGTWRLDVAASELGKGPRVPKWREDRIVRDGDWIAVKVTSVRTSGDTVRLDFRYHTAGEAVNRLAGQEVRTRGRREGGKLALESEAQLALFKFEVSERWSVSADGATLTQERTSRSPMGEESQRLVMRRLVPAPASR
jgi:hypothetical protein